MKARNVKLKTWINDNKETEKENIQVHQGR